MIKVLFFGDIVGRPGRTALMRFLEEEKESIRPDLIVANADNLSSGRGPTLNKYEEMVDAGIDILTCGDHIWDQKEAIEILEKKNSRLIRPYNYPKICPGKGLIEVKIKGEDIVVASFLGRIWTTEGLDSPFEAAEEMLSELKSKIILIDFHAEATSEKIAFGYDLTGKATAVLGTHTHVQTADERILEDHTAYISDIGFCGPYDSVIGIDPKCSVKRFRTGMPLQFDLAEGRTQVNAVILEIDEKTGKALAIKRVQKLYE